MNPWSDVEKKLPPPDEWVIIIGGTGLNIGMYDTRSHEWQTQYGTRIFNPFYWCSIPTPLPDQDVINERAIKAGYPVK